MYEQERRNYLEAIHLLIELHKISPITVRGDNVCCIGCAGSKLDGKNFIHEDSCLWKKMSVFLEDQGVELDQKNHSDWEGWLL